MGGWLSKSKRVHSNRWVFPVEDAIRQVVPPEFIAVEDVDDEIAAVTRAIEISVALSASQQNVIADDNDKNNNKKKLRFYKYFADWLPRLTLCPAICMLILNIFMPGLGTMIFSFKWFSPEDFIIPTSKMQRGAIVCACFLYGFMQFLLTPFIFGWLWSITTGVIAVQQARWVSVSEAYSQVIDQHLRNMINAKREAARGHLHRIHHRQQQTNSSDDSSSASGSSTVIVDISMPSSASSPYSTTDLNELQESSNGNQGRSSSFFNLNEAFHQPDTRLPLFSPLTSLTGAKPPSMMTNSGNKVKIQQRRSNDIHPTNAGHFVGDNSSSNVAVASSEDVGGGKNSPTASSRSSSHKSSRKLSGSLSFNRIGPAPCRPSRLSLTSSSSIDTQKSPQETEKTYKAVSISQSVPVEQRQTSKAWANEPEVPAPIERPPQEKPQVKEKDDSSGDVVFDLTMYKEEDSDEEDEIAASKPPTITEHEDLAVVEDIL